VFLQAISMHCIRYTTVVEDIFSLLQFLVRDGDITKSTTAGRALLDNVIRQSSAALLDKPGAGTVTVCELGVTALQFCLAPKAKAILDSVPRIWQKKLIALRVILPPLGKV
jgi:hypothetical protein